MESESDAVVCTKWPKTTTYSLPYFTFVEIMRTRSAVIIKRFTGHINTNPSVYHLEQVYFRRGNQPSAILFLELWQTKLGADGFNCNLPTLSESFLHVKITRNIIRKTWKGFGTESYTNDLDLSDFWRSSYPAPCKKCSPPWSAPPLPVREKACSFYREVAKRPRGKQGEQFFPSLPLA